MIARNAYYCIRYKLYELSVPTVVVLVQGAWASVGFFAWGRSTRREVYRKNGIRSMLSLFFAMLCVAFFDLGIQIFTRTIVISAAIRDRNGIVARNPAFNDQQKEVILNALVTVRDSLGHHSTPLREGEIELDHPDVGRVDLMPDSTRRGEYWVFVRRCGVSVYIGNCVDGKDALRSLR